MKKNKQRILSLIMAVLMTLVAVVPTNVDAATFAFGGYLGNCMGYEIYAYTIDGQIGFCMDYGYGLPTGGLNEDSTKSYSSDGASDLSTGAKYAKLAYYWSHSSKSKTNRMITQALLWGIRSGENIKSLCNSYSDSLYNTIFKESGNIKATYTIYKGSSGQKMAVLDADKRDEDVAVIGYTRDINYRQKITFKKTDNTGKTLKDKVFGIRLETKNLSSIKLNKGVFVTPEDIEGTKATQPWYAIVSANGDEQNKIKIANNGNSSVNSSAISGKTTKFQMSTDNMEQFYQKSNENTVVFVMTDGNGEVDLTFMYEYTSPTYYYGVVDRNVINSYSEWNNKKNDIVTIAGEEMTVKEALDKAYNKENKPESSYNVYFKERAMRNVIAKYRMDASGNIMNGDDPTYGRLYDQYYNIENYYGIYEIANSYGNAFGDNTLSLNPDIDTFYKWVKINRNNSYVSSTDGLTGATNPTYKTATYSSIGKYSTNDGGTYSTSIYVDDDNSWMNYGSTNEDKSWTDIVKTTVLSTDTVSGNAVIINAPYKYAKNSVNKVISKSDKFTIHKTNEDGKALKNTEFKVKADFKDFANNNTYNADSTTIKVNGKTIRLDNDNTFTAITDANGDINVEYTLKKTPTYYYAYGQVFNYNTNKYVDVESDNYLSNLETEGAISSKAAAISGLKTVFANATDVNNYSIDTTAYSKNKALEMANSKLSSYENNWFKKYEETAFSFEIVETNTNDDSIAINKELVKGIKADVTNGNIVINVKTDSNEDGTTESSYIALKDEEMLIKGIVLNEDKDTITIINPFKYYSMKLVKTDVDTEKAIEGAVFGVYEDSDFTKPATLYTFDKNGNSKVVNETDENGNVKVVEYTTDKDGVLHTDYLRAENKAYYFKEISAPEGYLDIYQDYTNENDLLTFLCDGKDINDYVLDDYQEILVGNKRVPKIKTKITDKQTNNDVSLPEETITLVDTVNYENLKTNTEYTVSGTLMDKETGKAYKDKDGNDITASTTFTSSNTGNGSVDVTFTFEAPDDLKGKSLVAYEEVLNTPTPCVHADINDEEQTVHFPKVGTSAKSGETNKNTGFLSDEVTIVDVVDYENLKKGEEYKVVGTLVDKETGEKLLNKKGNEIKASETFTADSSDGSVKVTFSFKKGNIYIKSNNRLVKYDLRGKSVVVFEKVYDKNNKLIGRHEDKTDDNQTVSYPDAKTKATDKVDGDSKFGKGKVTIVDTVTYKNLTPGRKYKVTGTLMDKLTGKAVMVDGKKVTGTATFTPEDKNGSVDVEITFDTTNLNLGEYVVFEEVKDVKTELKVVEHKDIDDNDQTISIIGGGEGEHTPQTGDMSKIPVMMVTMLLSLLGLISMVVLKRKNQKRITK